MFIKCGLDGVMEDDMFILLFLILIALLVLCFLLYLSLSIHVTLPVLVFWLCKVALVISVIICASCPGLNSVVRSLILLIPLLSWSTRDLFTAETNAGF